VLLVDMVNPQNYSSLVFYSSKLKAPSKRLKICFLPYPFELLTLSLELTFMLRGSTTWHKSLGLIVLIDCLLEALFGLLWAYSGKR
jgi:hypothetical protein